MKFQQKKPNKLIGCMTGISQTIIGHPFDTIKSRMHNSQKYTSVFECLLKTVRNEGFFAVYKGASTQFFTAFARNGVQFGVFNALKYRSHDLMTCSAAAGFVASLLTCPIERVKIQQQVDTELRSLSITEVIRRTGHRGVYRGFMCTAVRDIVQSCGLFGGFYYSEDWWLTPPDVPIVYSKVFLSGALGGLLCWAPWVMPIDFCKTQIQSGQRYNGFYECFNDNLKRFGPSVFFRGYPVVLVRSVVVGGFIFSSSVLAKRALGEC